MSQNAPDMNPNSAGGPINFGAIDWNKIIARAKEIIINPKETWPKIRAESSSIRDVYMSYVMILAAIPAIFGFISMSIIGISLPLFGTYRVPLVNGLVQMVLQYGLTLAIAYVAALVLAKLAPSFGGQSDETQTFKLYAYAATASYVGGVFMVLPFLGAIVGLICAIYTIYTFYTGITVMTGVPAERKLPYFAVSAVTMIVLSVIIGIVVAAVSPSPQMGSSSGLNNVQQPDLRSVEESLKQLHKLMPDGAK